MGPTLRDGAIVPGPVNSSKDLPRGVHDLQSPGPTASCAKTTVRYSDGPSVRDLGKTSTSPPARSCGAARSLATHWSFVNPIVRMRSWQSSAHGPVTLLRCAYWTTFWKRVSIAIRDIRSGDSNFIAVVECASPADTCFCASMKSGPGIDEDFDVALTELNDELGHRFIARIGSPRGADVLSSVSTRPAKRTGPRGARTASRDGVARDESKPPFDEVANLLARNVEHLGGSTWPSGASPAATATSVCPTCFCSDVHDTTDTSGAIERRRTWSSCFDLEHSYLHGGSVHESSSSRYRQWMTHKLSTWWDQFDSTGCVGCGRCIVWCPVGIDITEEVAAHRRARPGSSCGPSRPGAS